MDKQANAKEKAPEPTPDAMSQQAASTPQASTTEEKGKNNKNKKNTKKGAKGEQAQPKYQGVASPLPSPPVLPKFVPSHVPTEFSVSTEVIVRDGLFDCNFGPTDAVTKMRPKFWPSFACLADVVESLHQCFSNDRTYGRK